MNRLKTGLPFFLLFLLLVGCATTSLQGVWENPEYGGGSLGKVLVVAVSDQEIYRRLFEDTFCGRLRELGVEAEPGYALFPGRKLLKKEEITDMIEGRGFDAFIISKVTGKRTKEVSRGGGYSPFWGSYYYEPPHFHYSWYDYYSRSYAMIHDPIRRVVYDVVTVESDVYDSRTEELIWSALSETTVEQGNIEKLIRSLTSTVVDRLSGTELIRPAGR